MGLGIIAFIKSLAPITLYGVAIILSLMALIGRIRWPFLFLIALQPLQNVTAKLEALPWGNQIDDILLICIIIGWFVNASSHKEKLFEKSPINRMAWILIIYTYFAFIRGCFYLNNFNIFDITDPRLQDWKNYIILPILCFITINTIKDKKWIKRTIVTVCVTFIFMNYYLVQQLNESSGLLSRGKALGTFTWLGTNELAAFYNQYTVLLVSIYFSVRHKFAKPILLIIILVNIYCILFLYSRGAYAGLALGLIVLFLFKKRIFLIPLVVVLLFWQAFLPQQVKDRILMTTNEYGELEESAGNRIIVWQQSMDLFKKEPLMGVGFAVFRSLGFRLGDTHNIYIKIMAEQGTIGLIIFLGLIGTFLGQGWKLFRRGDDDFSRSLGIGFVACVFTMLVNNMFGDRWTYLPVSSFLWVFVGLVTRYNIIIDNAVRQKAVNSAGPEQPMRVKRRR